MIQNKIAPTGMGSIGIDTIGANVTPTWSGWLRTGVRLFIDDMKRAGCAVYGLQQRYEQRRELAELDDRMLKDIGLTRAQVEKELARPFWK